MEIVKAFAARDFRETVVCLPDTIIGVASGIGGFGFTAAQLLNAQSCTISVLGTAINILTTGDGPTAIFGIYVGVGQTAEVVGNLDINRLQLFSISGAAAYVTICLEWDLVPQGEG